MIRTGAQYREGLRDGRVASTLEFGSHCIVVGAVADLATGEGAPLVYAGRKFRKLVAA